MTKKISYDEQLAAILPALEGYVPRGMTLADLPRFRALSTIERQDLVGDAPVECIDHQITGFDGGEILVSVIRKHGHAGRGPGIYCIHGGGMVMGNRFAGMQPAVNWALAHDAVCVTVEYRLAPEHPAPVGVEDCYAGLCWMAGEAKSLGIDPDWLVIFGGSGGGGLAAGTTFLARDRGGPGLRGQLLQCPMIDDRDDTGSTKLYEGVGVWDRISNRTAWDAILGDRRGGRTVDPATAPARATNLSELPPTFIDVGSEEVFRDEAVNFARNIWAAGGSCELHVWGGAFHGFYDIAPEAEISVACVDARDAWLARLLRR
ncbi:esterase [Sphingomonas sp. DBB INV C78]